MGSKYALGAQSRACRPLTQRNSWAWCEPRGCECRSGSVHTAGTVHAAARVRGGGGEVEAADRRGCPAQAGYGPEDHLLVEGRRAAIDRAPDQVSVTRLELGRPEDPAGDDAACEPGCVLLDSGLHSVGKSLNLARIPGAGQLAAGV